MDMRITRRPAFNICGWAAETTLAGNDADIAALYQDFFDTAKEPLLSGLMGCQSGYYGLEWYTEGHRSFFTCLAKRWTTRQRRRPAR